MPFLKNSFIDSFRSLSVPSDLIALDLDGASFEVNSGSVYYCELDQDVSITSLQGSQGASCWFIFQQDGIGGRELSISGAYSGDQDNLRLATISASMLPSEHLLVHVAFADTDTATIYSVVNSADYLMV